MAATGVSRTVSVKWQHNGEFRRFGVELPVGGEGAYVTLLGKIQAMAPNPHFEGLFAWRDEDGDLIVLTNDEELKEAVRNAKDDVLRICTVVRGKNGVVRLSKGDGSGEKEKEMETGQKEKAQAQETGRRSPGADLPHPRVQCDGCDAGITGIRFKCTTCPDYDLCADCECKGLHNQHIMIRIADPRDHSWRRLLWHGRRGHHGGMWGPWGPNRGRGHCRRGMPGGRTASADPGNGEQPVPPPFDLSQFANVGGHFLRDVGESVAAALNNLGIDVDIDIEHEGQRENVAGKDKGKKEEGDGQKEKESGTNAQTKTNSTTTTTTTTMTSEVGDKDKDKEGEREIPIELEQPTNDSPVPMDNTHSDENSPVNHEWTLVENPPIAPQTMTQPPVPTGPAAPPTLPHPLNPTGGLYPVPPTPYVPPPTHPAPHALPHHPNPLINHAVEHMMAMGFGNEGGWLTQLLELKNGNISAALDALSAHHRNN